MNYKKLTIYALIINILMNVIFFIDNTFLTDTIGYYIYFLILLVAFIFYYIKKYDKKYDKKVIFKDILITVMWGFLSGLLGVLFSNLSESLKPCDGIGFSCFLYKIEYLVLAIINILYGWMILVINGINLLLKKTKLSDKKNIMISIPAGIVSFLLIVFIIQKILEVI